MLEGLEILISRMDTNPDEFIDGHWDYFLEDNPVLSDIFTEEEKEAFKEARVRLTEFKTQRHRQKFTEQVIERIVNVDYHKAPTGNHPLRNKQVTDIIRQGIEKMQWQYEQDGGRK